MTNTDKTAKRWIASVLAALGLSQVGGWWTIAEYAADMKAMVDEWRETKRKAEYANEILNDPGLLRMLAK